MVKEISIIILLIFLIISAFPFNAIKVGNEPICILCNSGYIYVLNYNSSTISVINPSNNVVISTINVSFKPISMVSAGDKIYVASSGCNKMDVIENGKLLKTINLTSTPYYVAYDCKTKELIVTEPVLESIIILKNCNIIGNISLNYPPSVIAFDPINCLLYVGSAFNRTIYVYNMNGNLITSYYIGGQVVNIKYCHGEIFVTSWGNNELTIINSSSSNVFHYYAGLKPYDAIYDPSDGYIYVTDFGTGSILVLCPNGNVVQNITIGGKPSNLIYRDGYIYVVDPSFNEVIVIPQVPRPSPPYCLYYLIAGGVVALVIIGYFVIKREMSSNNK